MGYNLQFRDVFAAWELFLEGIWVTLGLSAVAMLGSLILGTVLAVGRIYGPSPIQRVVIAYIEVIRNTPLLVQLFFVYFGLPAVGIRFDGITSATIAFVVYLSAYTAEIIRAGIEAVPNTQVEAGESLGLSYPQVFRHIILVPALKDMYPALSGQFIFFMLASSVVSQISVQDLFHAGALVQARTFRDFEIYLVIGALYLALTMAFRLAFWLIYRATLGRDD